MAPNGNGRGNLSIWYKKKYKNKRSSVTETCIEESRVAEEKPKLSSIYRKLWPNKPK